MRDLNRDEHHLLDWLAKDDTSLYGECHGPALSALFVLELAHFVSRDERGRMWDRVALTELGFCVLKRMGPFDPAQPPHIGWDDQGSKYTAWDKIRDERRAEKAQ